MFHGHANNCVNVFIFLVKGGLEGKEEDTSFVNVVNSNMFL